METIYLQGTYILYLKYLCIIDFQGKILWFFLQLGESESEKLDLRDQSERLEERIAELMTSSAVYIATESTQAVTGLQETLKAKDQYINQLEQELVMMKKEANKTVSKKTQYIVGL